MASTTGEGVVNVPNLPVTGSCTNGGTATNPGLISLTDLPGNLQVTTAACVSAGECGTQDNNYDLQCQGPAVVNDLQYYNFYCPDEDSKFITCQGAIAVYSNSNGHDTGNLVISCFE